MENEMVDQNEKTLFKSTLIQQKYDDFNAKLEKFKSMFDPIERYIIRLEMKEIKDWLDINSKFDVIVP